MREEAQARRAVTAAHAQIEADRRQATVPLRQEVGRYRPDLAGQIIGESLDDEARQSRVVDRFLDELEAQPVRSGTASAAESS